MQLKLLFRCLTSILLLINPGSLATEVPIFGDPTVLESVTAESPVLANEMRLIIDSKAIAEPPAFIQKNVRDQFNNDIQSSLGGWTGNGGDGFACFESREAMNRSLDSNGKFLLEHLNDVLMVVPRDLATRPTLWPNPVVGETVISYINRLLRTSPIKESPYLEAQFRLFLRQMFNADGSLSWNRKNNLAPIVDQGSFAQHENHSKLRQGCVPVQIVHRYQRKNSEESGQMFYDYDPLLIEKVLYPYSSKAFYLPENAGIRAFSSLLLHEAAFAISSFAGQDTSMQARFFVNEIFNDYSFALKRNISGAVHLESIKNMAGFDQYYNSINISSNMQAFPGSQRTWLEIRKSVNLKEKKILEQLSTKSNENDYNRVILTHLSPEERWYFYAIYFERKGILQFKTDYLLLEHREENLKILKRHTCDLIRNFFTSDQAVVRLCR